MRGHENHVFDDEPLYEQVHTGMVFVTRDGGHVVRVTRVNKQADEITLTYDLNGETEVRSADGMWMFWDQEALAVPSEVLRDPEAVVTEYALLHVGRDLETLGRDHEYHVAGCERVSDIEFALWAVNEARRDNWPPSDAAGIHLGDSPEESEKTR
jgi:hypothetical protein